MTKSTRLPYDELKRQDRRTREAEKKEDAMNDNDEGLQELLDAISELSEEDLRRLVKIRGRDIYVSPPLTELTEEDMRKINLIIDHQIAKKGEEK